MFLSEAAPILLLMSHRVWCVIGLLKLLHPFLVIDDSVSNRTNFDSLVDAACVIEWKLGLDSIRTANHLVLISFRIRLISRGLQRWFERSCIGRSLHIRVHILPFIGLMNIDVWHLLALICVIWLLDELIVIS